MELPYSRSIRRSKSCWSLALSSGVLHARNSLVSPHPGGYWWRFNWVCGIPLSILPQDDMLLLNTTCCFRPDTKSLNKLSHFPVMLYAFSFLNKPTLSITKKIVWHHMLHQTVSVYGFHCLSYYWFKTYLELPLTFSCGAFFPASGGQPSSYDFWNIMLIGNFMDCDNSLNTLGWSPSGSADFFVFSFLGFCSIWSMAKVIEAEPRPCCFCAISWMLSISSWLNALTKYWSKISRFALSSIMLSSVSVLLSVNISSRKSFIRKMSVKF